VTDGRHSTPDDATDAAPAATDRDLLSLPAVQTVDTRPPRPVKADPNRVRLCVVTRTELPPAQLIRFVAGPDDRIFPDLDARLPGRGVWVSATHASVALAAKRGLFAKSLKKQVKVDNDLADQVDQLLVAAARQALALANKAGLVTTGFSKVESTLERGTAIALISANDASADGIGKLARKFTAIRKAAGQKAPILQELTSGELGLAIGGSNVIHASLAGGVLAQRFIGCCHRLGHYRMNSGGIGSHGVRTGAPDWAAVEPATQVSSAAECPHTSIEETKSDQAGTDNA
jgi:uncharacterized protein